MGVEVLIFVDSSAWYANAVAGDASYKAASDWLAQNIQRLLTTDYVVDETLTLLRSRGKDGTALRLGEQFFSGTLAEVYFLAEEDVRQAWKVFRDYSDKQWSFTDCSSKVVMEKLGITQAFAFDQHFHQFGSVTVVP